MTCVWHSGYNHTGGARVVNFGSQIGLSVLTGEAPSPARSVTNVLTLELFLRGCLYRLDIVLLEVRRPTEYRNSVMCPDDRSDLIGQTGALTENVRCNELAS